ncbi:MAG: hypothetical protein ACJAYJ_004613 [Saprospiraceae bacterium]|jgi:hypothetical protein
MRCHGDQVGNGGVGCREWDYSCNTFITDPNRVDSTRATHPTHIVSNFSGDSFDYSDAPTYTYYQYNQHETVLTANNTTEATVGNGEIPLPLAGGQEVTRAQFLMTAIELQNGGLTAGDIHALKMDLSALGAQIAFLKIKLKTTNLTELDADNPENTGFSEVYFQNTDFDNLGLKDFNFYNSFDWNGTDNVIVEFSFTTSNTGGGITVKGTDTGFNSAIFSGTSDHALFFSGSGTVAIPTDNFASVSEEITISLWQYGTADVMPASSYAFEGLDADNNRQANAHLPWSNSQVYWDCGNDGGGYDRINKLATEADFEGKWNHWAFTKNAVSGVMKIYLNGVEWHSGTGKNKLIDISQFNIGSSANLAGKYWGSIDEFRVWSKALDENTIREYMRKSVDVDHPNADDLVAYYQMNEGTGFTLSDASPSLLTADISLPNWQIIRGEDLYKNFTNSTVRPNFTFVQGDVTVEDVLISVIDSTINPLHQVTEYEVAGTDLMAINTQFFYPSGEMYTYNEAGEILGSTFVAASGNIQIGSLTYYNKVDAKYELVSLVTPYGNGLDLGIDGKTFTLDVTDFAPILKGERRISLEMGGQFQEEMNIKFLFIEGTPPREVIDIQQVWPFRRGWFDQILNDVVFEPRQVQLSPNGSHFQLRSAITGHGQNGEFVSRNHYLNVNGGAQDFTYDVWKYCGKNPVYPQGGTWIFDRAGWCPGMATDINIFDITGSSPGDIIEVDYGLNGAMMTEANYLVNNQLVTYGAYNFTNDASIEFIMRPNNKQVEFERINPACTTPMIQVKNTGSNAISSLEIEYTVKGGTPLTYTWNGTIVSNGTTEIVLPVETMTFWETPLEDNIFEAQIVTVNGGADEQPDNDSGQSTFTPAKVFDYDNPLEIQVNTNLVPSDNSYLIKDSEGNIVLERDNLNANAQYKDALDLPAGCYSFELEDAGNDGLSFWFFPNNGNGSVRFNRIINGTIALSIQSFNADFGGGVQFDFVMPQLVGTEDLETYRLLSVFPNPTFDEVNIELHGFENDILTMELTDLTGRVLISKTLSNQGVNQHIEAVDLNDFAKGMYFLKVSDGERNWVRQVVKQ